MHRSINAGTNTQMALIIPTRLRLVKELIFKCHASDFQVNGTGICGKNGHERILCIDKT